ncbi:hypothetical protein C0993_005380 [Termitomyces sp. T159_Od127]|nr:hypothetical protein C0993_005380 [Termitomyces sp. T159_Od127]
MIITKQALPDDPTPLDCPPSYDTISADLTRTTPRDEKRLAPVNTSSASAAYTSTSPSPSSSAKHPSSSNAKGKGKGSSWFGFMTSKPAREVQATVLGLIRDLVKEQNHNQNRAALAILDSCAEACTGYDLTLSAILQVRSIEGHTPMYWAIVKRAPDDDDEEHGKTVPDLLTALISYATPLSAATIADIRHACLLTSDQLLFQRLRMSPEFAPLSGTDEMLLGASIPPDAITVENVVGGGDEGAFSVYFEVALFQKRMRVSKSVQLDFIARARMWRLEFLIAESPSRHRDKPRQGSWCISLSLLENSPPTWIDSRLLVPEPTPPSPDTLSSPDGPPSLPSSPSLIDRLRLQPRSSKPKPAISIRLRSPQQLAPLGTRSRRDREICEAIVVSLDESAMGSSLQHT